MPLAAPEPLDVDPQAMCDLLDRLLAKGTLYQFSRLAWRHAGLPGDFQDGWHIKALCERLEGASRMGWGRELWASPPRSTKSTVMDVFWPAWTWAQDDDPERLMGRWVQFLHLSHREDLATRDSQRCRILLKSDWYQELTEGRVQIRPDADQSSYFALEGGGSRRAYGLRAGVTGHDSDVRVIDDPYATDQVFSAAERARMEFVWDEMLPSRVNHPTRNILVLAAQRTAPNDLHGKVINGADFGDWTFTSVSGVKEEGEAYASPDDHRAVGDVYWPERYTPESVMALANTAAAKAAQIQQNPQKREGKVFGGAQWSIVADWPRDAKMVRFWDLAATEEGRAADPDYTAGVLMAIDRDGVAYVVDVVRGRWSSLNVRKRVILTADRDGTKVPIWIEREPGASGIDVISDYQRNVLGGRFSVRGDRATGPKLVRIDPYLAAAEAGNVRLVRGEWNKAFLDEHDEWTGGDAEHDDQIIAATGAFRQLAVAVVDRGARKMKVTGI